MHFRNEQYLENRNKRLALFTRLILCVLCIFGFFIHDALAGNISGKVTDENGEGLPYVSIYREGTTVGVITNKDGNYMMDLPFGEHNIVFQFMGYKTRVERVNIDQPEKKIILNVQLEPQTYQIGAVTINAGDEDPAYGIIRQAVRKRKFYETQVGSYSCDVYIKGVQRVTEYPKKFMGIDVNAEGDIDPKTGIFYLSESVSRFYFKRPNNIHEEMISSKVSGNSKAFSFNRTADLLLDFYENNVNIPVVGKRGFISPIAESALFYYRYRLAATYYDKGNLINKIEVSPKRAHDPAFRGFIYIADSSWRIHSTNLFLTKDAGLEAVDTLRIEQVHVAVGNKDEQVWMLFSNKLTFNFALLGFKGNGMYLGMHSKYKLGAVKREARKAKQSGESDLKNVSTDMNAEIAYMTKKKRRSGGARLRSNRPSLVERLGGDRDSAWGEKVFAKGEMMKVNDDANKKDSSYWESVRPVPLTEEEMRDYHQKDSVQQIRESKPFLDSVDKKTNKFRPIDLLFGYSHINRYKKRYTEFSSLLESIQFNTVQGWVAGTEISIRKRYESGKQFVRSAKLSYGFADQRPNASARILYEYQPKKFSHFFAEGGRATPQFSEKRPISPLINSIYTLFVEENYLKSYQKDFLKLAWNSELINGVYLRSYAEYSNRTALLNHSDFTFFPAAKNEKKYTSNDPLKPLQDSLPSFATNSALELRFNLRLRFRQKYVTRPDDKWVFGSKYPTLNIEYRKAIPDVLSTSADYDLLRLSLSDRMNFKLLGRATWLVSAGKFLSNKNMILPDYYHFSGNKTALSNFDFSDFQMLDYYTWSTRDYFLEAHYEHDFSGWILNKLPLLRRLKLNELAGVHFLQTESLDRYTEVFFGLEKFNLARIDFVLSVSDQGVARGGFRFGLKLRR